MNPLNQVITVAEAVELSGFNVRKVQRYCKSGKFIARQDSSGTWLILKSSIQSKEENKMDFKQAQAFVSSMIRTRVSGYDGGLSHIEYFENQETLDDFILETGYTVEVLP